MELSFAGVVLAVLATVASAQQPINITGCTVPCNLGTTAADVLIFIDASNGMGQANLDMVKSALIQWQTPWSVGPSGASDQLRVAIIDYAVYATAHGLLVENHNDHAELVNLINDVKFRGYDNRNIYYGLLEGLGNLNANAGMRPGVQKIGMIFSAAPFTDGSAASAIPTFKSYTDAGFVFFGLGVGLNANIGELATLIGQPNNVFHTISAEQLQYVVGWLLNKGCNSSSGSTVTWPAFTTTPSFMTTTTLKPFRHCQDYCTRGDSSSGVKPILINGVNVNVYCNGCWTTIQSRAVGGKVNFNVSFEQYRQVLGTATSPPTDFYLGNDNIYALTSQFDMQLWVQPEDCDAGITNSLYSYFKIGSLSEKFKLNTSYAIGDAGDAFNVNSFGYSDQGRAFSTSATYDPTGGLPTHNCPSLLYGGWWFGNCKDNLNGKWYQVSPPYCETTVPDGIRWIRPGNYTLMRSKMFVCPSDCPQPF